MKNLTAAWLIILPSFIGYPQATVFSVKGKVLRVPSHCGGMVLTKEMLKRMKPYPYVNKKFYLRTGEKNDITKPIYKEIITDSNGNFEISLPPGTYSIIDENKKNSKYADGLKKKFAKKSVNYDAVDKECLKKWLKTPDGLIVVTDAPIEDYTVKFHERCSWEFPCVEYTGDPPP